MLSIFLSSFSRWLVTTVALLVYCDVMKLTPLCLSVKPLGLCFPAFLPWYCVSCYCSPSVWYSFFKYRCSQSRGFSASCVSGLFPFCHWNVMVCVVVTLQFYCLVNSHTMKQCILSFWRFRCASLCVALGTLQIFVRHFHGFCLHFGDYWRLAYRLHVPFRHCLEHSRDKCHAFYKDRIVISFLTALKVSGVSCIALERLRVLGVIWLGVQWNCEVNQPFASVVCQWRRIFHGRIAACIEPFCQSCTCYVPGQSLIWGPSSFIECPSGSLIDYRSSAIDLAPSCRLILRWPGFGGCASGLNRQKRAEWSLTRRSVYLGLVHMCNW